METFWFFWLRFRRAYDSAYDSDFLFLLGHKRSYHSAYDSDSDSVASENQPLRVIPTIWEAGTRVWFGFIQCIILFKETWFAQTSC